MYVPSAQCPVTPTPVNAVVVPTGMSGLRRGLGCAGRDCRCGGACGMGRGLGLFDTPFDLSTWGWQEWGIAIIGGYMLFSTILTSRRASRKISKSLGRRRSRAQRRRELQEELKGL